MAFRSYDHSSHCLGSQGFTGDGFAGVVVSELINPFFPEIIQTLEDLAVEHNYEILVISTAQGKNGWSCRSGA